MITEKKVITFLYHEVVDDPSESGFQRASAIPYKHKIHQFLNDLEAILQNFKNSIKVEDICNLKEDNNLILTFDDGGISALTTAKILKERGLIGHFFITTSMIGKKGFLNANQINQIFKMGHLIGSHSHNHPDIFRDLTKKEKIFEWEKSKVILEKIISAKIIMASIPGGDMDIDTIKTASETGIKYLFTSEPNFKPYKKFNTVVVGRVCPKIKTSSNTIIHWSKGKGYIKLQIIRFLKEIIRKKLKVFYKFYITNINS